MATFTGPFTAPAPRAVGPALPHPSGRSVAALLGLIALHCAIAVAMTTQIVAAANAASGGMIGGLDEIGIIGPRPWWAVLAAWIPWMLVVLIGPMLLAGGAPRASRIVPLVGIVVTLAAPLIIITTFAA